MNLRYKTNNNNKSEELRRPLFFKGKIIYIYNFFCFIYCTGLSPIYHHQTLIKPIMLGKFNTIIVTVKIVSLIWN